jgi:hypothetical protein
MVMNLKIENNNDLKTSNVCLFNCLKEDDTETLIFDYSQYSYQPQNKTTIYFIVYEVLE